MAFRVPEKYRIIKGPMASNKSYGNNGKFKLRIARLKFKRLYCVIASDQGGWEHVSVSLPERTPTWEEMNCIKSMFWGDEDAVMQLHPPKSEYVNNHEFCLHLWRPTETDIPMPPSIFVGVK